MGWQPTVYTVAGVVIALVSGALATQAVRHRNEEGAIAFAGLMGAWAVWSLAVGVQLGFTDQSGQLFWHKVAIAVAGTVPTFWLLFTLPYAGKDHLLDSRGQFVLVALPGLFALFAMTNPADLMWTETGLDTSTPGQPILRLALGPAYYAYFAYGHFVIACGLAVLVSVLAQDSVLYRRQTAILIFGPLPTIGANIAYLARIELGPLPALDPTPFVFLVTGLLYGLALFRLDLLERTPIARRRVLDEMGDGLVVLDEEGLIVDHNQIARDAFDPTPTVDQSITSLVSGNASTVEDALETLEGETVTASIDGSRCVYDIDCDSLTDQRGVAVGYVIAFRDVTERNDYQNRLEVAQRVLRHNLRNEMNVIIGWANEFGEDDHRPEEAQRIIDTADDLVDLSEKVRMLVRIREQRETASTVVPVSPCVSRLVSEFRETNPDATIDCQVTDNLQVSIPDSEFLEIPIRNLIENAIEHSDHDEPWVSVRAEQLPDSVRICIQDDGPPISEDEWRVLEDGAANPLEHGSGVGIWLTYQAVRTAGGSISFDRRDPSGNVITIEYPDQRSA